MYKDIVKNFTYSYAKSQTV